MGSGGTSNTQPQGLGTLSLGPIAAAQAFGLPTFNSRGGGIGIGNGQILPQLFGPNTFAPLQDLSRTYQPFQDPGLFNQIGQQSSQLLGGVLPKVNELAQTGFGDRIANLSSFLFQNDIAPQLEEQFGSQLGLDTGDADTRAALIRAGQENSLQAANQSVQNQILGLQMAQSAPAAVAEQAGGVEQLLQQGSRTASPAGQLLDLLNSFGQINTQAGGVGGGTHQKNWGVL